MKHRVFIYLLVNFLSFDFLFIKLILHDEFFGLFSKLDLSYEFILIIIHLNLKKLFSLELNEVQMEVKQIKSMKISIFSTLMASIYESNHQLINNLKVPFLYLANL